MGNSMAGSVSMIAMTASEKKITRSRLWLFPVNSAGSNMLAAVLLVGGDVRGRQAEAVPATEAPGVGTFAFSSFDRICHLNNNNLGNTPFSDRFTIQEGRWSCGTSRSF
ncbi:hypothetical protein [Streptosporangium sp. NPDC000396]|uniref:hypothetical protein n=1 Tax=Streptosporangium sp. NPDC000396 TaxID=3366185 RepID=UPI0036CB839B